MLTQRHITRKAPKARYLVLWLAACLCLGISLTALQQPAYATEAKANTSVFFQTDAIEPLERISYTGEGEFIKIDEHSDYVLEAQFSGGNGNLSYEWAVSTDGGASFVPLEATEHSYLIKDATPLAHNASYLYRLFTYDESVQRVQTMYEVLVVPLGKLPIDTRIDTTNTLTPQQASYTNGQSSNANGQAGYAKGQSSPKTGDGVLEIAVMHSVVALAALLTLGIARRRDRSHVVSNHKSTTTASTKKP